MHPGLTYSQLTKGEELLECCKEGMVDNFGQNMALIGQLGVKKNTPRSKS